MLNKEKRKSSPPPPKASPPLQPSPPSHRPSPTPPPPQPSPPSSAPSFTESERPCRWVHTCLHSSILTSAAAAAEPNPLAGSQPLQSAQSLLTSDLMSALTRIKVKRQKCSPTSSAGFVLAAPAEGGGRVGESC